MLIHAKINKQYSGIKHCTSMKEIMEELSKIIEGSGQKEQVLFDAEDWASSFNKTDFVIQSDASNDIILNDIDLNLSVFKAIGESKKLEKSQSMKENNWML